MYTLTYTYEGHGNKTPYTTTIATSNNLEALLAEMNTSIEWDTTKKPEDECNDECNFKIHRRKGKTEVTLQHRFITNLYATYRIESVVEI